MYLWRWRPKKTAVLALSRTIFRIHNKYVGRCIMYKRMEITHTSKRSFCGDVMLYGGADINSEPP